MRGQLVFVFLAAPLYDPCAVANPNPLLYIQREGTEAGPYDLVQMAGLMRRKIIDGETLTRVEGDDAWKPFSWQPQFSVVREMPADAVSMRLDELDEAAADKDRPPIPLPSLETVIRISGMLVGCFCAGLGSYLLARLDPGLGTTLLYSGVAAVVIAQCLLYARVMDEDWLTMLQVFFMPGGDIYYYVSRFWQNFSLYCAKYGGAAIALGAMWGMATHR
jgi:hypothetical protein